MNIFTTQKLNKIFKASVYTDSEAKLRPISCFSKYLTRERCPLKRQVVGFWIFHSMLHANCKRCNWLLEENSTTDSWKTLGGLLYIYIVNIFANQCVYIFICIYMHTYTHIHIYTNLIKTYLCLNVLSIYLYTSTSTSNFSCLHSISSMYYFSSLNRFSLEELYCFHFCCYCC